MPTETYNTVGQHQWTVPDNVTQVTVECWGAQGQSGDQPGGEGGYVQGTIPVTPGEVYDLTVGGQPTSDSGGYPDGGSTGVNNSNGGGSSAFWEDINDPQTRLFVGAGGGGGGDGDENDDYTDSSRGGQGGPSTGEKAPDANALDYDREGGHGGTQDSGGAGGDYGNTGGDAGSDGSFAQGGDANNSSSSTTAGAGGGGWYGGGAGERGSYTSGSDNISSGAGGGGGSNYIDGGASSTTSTRGVRTGDGEIVLTYEESADPEITSIDSAGDSISLTWTADDWDGVRLYRHTEPDAAVDGIELIDTTNTSYTDSSVSLGTRYYYQVVGYISATGHTSASNAETAVTAPPNVDGFSLDASVQDELTVELEPDLNNTGNYRIRWKRSSSSSYASEDEIVVAYDASPLEGVISPLLDGEKFDIGVRAETEHSNGDYHTASEITKLVPVSGIQFDPVDDTVPSHDSDLLLEWVIESDYEGSQQIYRYESTGEDPELGTLIATVDNQTVTYTDSAGDLEPGRDYTYTIRTQTDYVHADSSATFVTSRAGLQAALYAEIDDPRQADPISLDPPKAIRNATLRHTATSDVEIATQDLGPDLRDLGYLNPDVDIRTRLIDSNGTEVRDDRLFKGVVGEVSTQGDSDEATLKTKGRGWYLDSSTPDSPVEITNSLVWEAIKDYVNNQLTEWTVDVTPDPGETIEEDALAQNPDTQSEWESVLSANLANTDPIAITNGSVELLQTLFINDGSETPYQFNGTGTVDDSAYSDGTAASFGGGDSQQWFPFSLGYTIPGSEVGIAVRLQTDGDAPPLDFALIDHSDGSEVGSIPLYNAETSLGLNWVDQDDGDIIGIGTWSDGDITPGEYRIEVSAGTGSESAYIDLITIYDTRYSYTFDTELHEPSGYLDGPELYPDSVSVVTSLVERQSNINAARLNSVWDDTSNNQSVAVSNTGGSDWVEASNATEVDANFAESELYGSNLQTRFAFSRRPMESNPQAETPRFGYQGQSIDSYELRFDQTSVAVIDSATYSDTHKSNLTALCDRGRMHWVIDHTADGKVLEVFPIGTEAPDSVSWSTIDWDRTDGSFDYANRIVARGATKPESERDSPDDLRYEAVVEDEEEIQQRRDDGLPEDKAVQTAVILDPEMSTQDEVNSAAFSALESRIENAQPSGSVNIVPTFIKPGYSYPVSEFEDESVPTPVLEQVSFSQEFGSSRGTLQFETSRNWVQALNPVERDVGGLKRLF